MPAHAEYRTKRQRTLTIATGSSHHRPPRSTLRLSVPRPARTVVATAGTVASGLPEGQDMVALVSIAVGYGNGDPPAPVLRRRRRAPPLHAGRGRPRGGATVRQQTDPQARGRARRSALPADARRDRAHAGRGGPPPLGEARALGRRRGEARGPRPRRARARAPLGGRDPEPHDRGPARGARALPRRASRDRARPPRGRIARAARAARAR